MLVTLSGIVILVKSEQPKNAPCPMLEKPSITTAPTDPIPAVTIV